MRKALRRLLICRGFRVEEYERGEELLAALGCHPLDCVLLDLHLPGLNGFDVLEALQARHIAAPVIVLTAHDEPGTWERAQALGALAYLKKPVDRDVLFRTIAAVTSVVTDRPTPVRGFHSQPGDRAWSAAKPPSPPVR